MELKEILSVSGKPGLFKVVAHTKSGLIVESLIDKKRIPVYASDKISNLEDISIFTTEEDMLLKDVLKLIYDKEKGGPCIESKADDKKLKEYMEAVLPQYDKDRVYLSDIKKLFSWYNLLQKNNLLDFTEKPEEPVEEPASEDADETKTPKKPAAKKKEPVDKKDTADKKVAKPKTKKEKE
jgi:hypothetical protein